MWPQSALQLSAPLAVCPTVQTLQSASVMLLRVYDTVGTYGGRNTVCMLYTTALVSQILCFPRVDKVTLGVIYSVETCSQ